MSDFDYCDPQRSKSKKKATKDSGLPGRELGKDDDGTHTLVAVSSENPKVSVLMNFP